MTWIRTRSWGGFGKWVGARKVQEDVDYCALIAEVTEATNTNVSQLAHALGDQERITDWLPMRLRQRWQRGQAIHLARAVELSIFC